MAGLGGGGISMNGVCASGLYAAQAGCDAGSAIATFYGDATASQEAASAAISGLPYSLETVTKYNTFDSFKGGVSSIDPVVGISEQDGSLFKVDSSASTFEAVEYSHWDFFKAGIGYTEPAKFKSPERKWVEGNFKTEAEDPTGEINAELIRTGLHRRADYSGNVPTAVPMPSRGPLLTSGTSDQIFARARARITRSHAANTRAALESSASLGIGMGSPALLRRLAEANQKKAEAISALALEQAAQEGVWAREDYMKVVDLELKDYSLKWATFRERVKAEEDTMRGRLEEITAELNEERLKLDWRQHTLNFFLQAQKYQSDAGIGYGQFASNALVGLSTEAAKLYAAMFQGWMSAINVNYGFSGSLGSTYNESYVRDTPL